MKGFELLIGADVDGMVRGKWVPSSKIQSTSELGFCGVIFAWDCMDAVYTRTALVRGLEGSVKWTEAKIPASESRKDGASQGYPDVIARIDSDHRRLLSLPMLGEDSLPINFVDFLGKDHLPLPYCPRSVLKEAITDLADSTAGLQARCAFELEWYNYQGDAANIINKPDGHSAPHLTEGMFGYSPLRPLQRSAYVQDILACSQRSGIQLDCFHTETGPGVYEAALLHAPALQAADNCLLFKQLLIKSIAHHHGLTASFMAKPWEDLPGCGGHCHVSLEDEQGNNAFTKDPQLLEHFVAGILLCLPDILPLLVSTVNGYKRLDLRYWAPVAVGWGEDDRLAAVRLIGRETNASRVEIRVPGADLNSYLALAAILRAGALGVRDQLPLGPPLQTNCLGNYERIMEAIGNGQLTVLPATLRVATERMLSPNSMARKIFPASFLDHYGMTRWHEIKLAESAVTDWDRRRYLETL